MDVASQGNKNGCLSYFRESDCEHKNIDFHHVQYLTIYANIFNFFYESLPSGLLKIYGENI